VWARGWTYEWTQNSVVVVSRTPARPPSLVGSTVEALCLRRGVECNCLGMSSRALNDVQLYVLSWIAQGCPAGVFDNDQHSHKISARALVNRGLVKIRRDGGWSATLTEAGRYYNEHGHFPLPEDAPVRAKVAAARARSKAKPTVAKGEPPPPRRKPPAEELRDRLRPE
jgi:hypothetical protein